MKDFSSKTVELNHQAEPFRPRLNTQISAYTKHQMELCEQIKNVLVIDHSHDDSHDDSNENQENSTSPGLNLPKTSSIPEINIDLGSMFPTPNTDLKEVNELKITSPPPPDSSFFQFNTTFDSSSSLSNSTFLQENSQDNQHQNQHQNQHPNQHQHELSAVGIITDNEVDRQVKSEIRGGKSWMTKEILVGIAERDRLFLEMKNTPFDLDLEESYKKKRNQVVTLTRRAKRDLKTKIRPAVESSIKFNIQRQVEEQGLDVVTREVKRAAMDIFFKSEAKTCRMDVGKASGRETPQILSGRSTPLLNMPLTDANGQFQPLNWKTIAKTYKNLEK